MSIHPRKAPVGTGWGVLPEQEEKTLLERLEGHWVRRDGQEMASLGPDGSLRWSKAGQRGLSLCIFEVLSMYIYICICIYVCICVCMCMYLYVFVCMCMYAYMCMYVNVCVCM